MWEKKFENFDNAIIDIVQYYHLKKESSSPLNKIFGYIFMIFSFILTCKLISVDLFNQQI
jgi:hypothetical protein